jgi:DNA-binding NarL/FixJ family response regulator
MRPRRLNHVLLVESEAALHTLSRELDPNIETRLLARGVDAVLAKTADMNLLVDQIRANVERATTGPATIRP